MRRRQRNFSLFVLLHKRAKPLPSLRSVGPSRTADLMCAFYYCRTYYKAVRVCFITAGPITKLCAWGEEESGGHVL